MVSMFVPQFKRRKAEAEKDGCVQMKAVILAGERRMRVHGQTWTSSKSMLPLFGRPVIEHLLLLLRGSGMEEVLVVLGQDQQAIRDHFGTGERFGMKLSYMEGERRESTAECLKACIPCLGKEDFFVTKAAAVCDFDLNSAIEFHREKQAKVTMLLGEETRSAETELVQVDQEGRVCRFVEPSLWRKEEGCLVSTGMLIINPQILEGIQDGEGLDLVEDILPNLAEKAGALYGWPGRGYWSSVEDWEGYHSCAMRVLQGKVKLELGLPQRREGIWSALPLPEGVDFAPPCWIGEGVSLGTESMIGPYSVLEQGVRIGAHSMVQRSVLMEDSQAGEKVTISGAVLCRNSAVQREVVLNAGTVLGEGALVRERSVLMEGVRVQKGHTVPAGSRLTQLPAAGEQHGRVRFGENGVISGVLGENIGPEALMAIGSCLGMEGKAALGYCGGMGAIMLAQAAATGVKASGGTVLHHSLETPAQGAWLAQRYQIPVSLFIEQQGERIFLHFFGRDGLHIGRSRGQKLEYALKQRGYFGARTGGVGEIEVLQVGMGEYCADAVRRARLGRHGLRTVTVAVSGDLPEERGLKQCLRLLGCNVVDQWRKGIPEFGASHGGFCLKARDERGSILEPEQLLPLLCLLEMENGGGKVAVPDGASAAADLVTAGFGGSCLRLGRDGRKAQSLYASLPWLWDAAFAAVRVVSRMSATGESLEGLMAKTPRFSVRKREVSIRHDRAQVMQELAREQRREIVGDGLRLRTGNGWVFLVPLSQRQALQVVAESQDMELAAELCDFYVGKVQVADRRAQKGLEK